MRTLVHIASLCVASLCVAATAQPYQAGYSDVTLVNSSGTGTQNVLARVFYPAQAAGQNQPMVSRSGGWPVMVFLPGNGILGQSYPALMTHFAETGYVIVGTDIPRFRNEDLVADGIGAFHGLVAANTAPGLLQGAVDMSRAAITGHSLGGGSAVELVASNPGYKACVTWAGTFPGGLTIRGMNLPLCIMHGQGDRHVQWYLSSLPIFNESLSFTGLKFLYLMNTDCDETNIVGFLGANPVDADVWRVSRAVTGGFLDHYLRDRSEGLEVAIGNTARSEQRFSRIFLAVEQPELWANGPATIGTIVPYVTTAEPGPIALFIAAGTANFPTPFGILRLDPFTMLALTTSAVPSTRLHDYGLPLPNDTGLLNAQLLLQGVGINTRFEARLTGLSAQTIQ